MTDVYDDQPMLQKPIYERRSQLPCSQHEQRIALTEQAVMSLKTTNEGMVSKLDRILAETVRVSLLEEKHATQQVDVNRAHTKLTDLESALSGLAIETRAFIAYSQGRDKVLWAIGAGVVVLGVKVLFFAANNGMTP